MEEILSSFVIGLVVTSVSFSFVLIFRKRIKNFYQPKVYLNNDWAPPEDDSWFGWIKYLFKVNDSDLLSHNGGIDFILYVKFIKYACMLFAVLTVIALPMLMPVYKVGTALDEFDQPFTGLNVYTIGHLEKSSSKYWVSLVSVFIFTILSWFLIYRLYSMYVNAVNVKLSRATTKSRSVVVSDIPSHIHTDSELQEYFEHLYPGEVMYACLAPELQSLTGIIAQRNKINKAYLAAKSKEEKSGKTQYHKQYIGKYSFIPFIKLVMGTKVASVETYQNQIEELDSRIRSEQEKIAKRNKVGFVIFHTTAVAMQAAQTLHKSNPRRMKVDLGPDPSGVRWKSLHLGRKERLVRRVVSWVILIVLFFFWSIPVGFISAWANLDSLSSFPVLNFLVYIIELSPVLRGFFEGFLPSLALILFFALLPKILYAILKFRGWYLQKSLDRQLFQVYWLFILVNVFLIITIAGSLFGALYEIIETPTSIAESLAKSLPSQAVFFTNYIIIQGMVNTSALWVARFVDLGFWRIVTLNAKTNEEKRIAAMSDNKFFFPVQYSKDTLIFTIGLVYSTLAPFILPFALAYFAIAFFAAKYNWTYVYVPKYEGIRMTRLLIDRLVVGILLYQLTLLGVFTLNEFVYGAGIVILIILTLIFRSYLHKRFKLPSRFLALENCPELTPLTSTDLDTDKEFYKHPSLKFVARLEADNKVNEFRDQQRKHRSSIVEQKVHKSDSGVFV